LRILFLLTQSLTDPSGLGRYWPLAKQMAKMGYQVEIAALHPAFGSLSERVFVKDGVNISYVAQMHVRQEGNRRFYFNTAQFLMVTALATAALTKAALFSRADVIHIGKAQPMNGLAGWLGAHLRNIPFYVDCDDDETASNRFSSKWQRNVVRWWENRLPLAAKGVTVNTSYLRDRCIRSGIASTRIKLIPNGFDPDRFERPALSEIEFVRQRWGLVDKKVILYIGSLSLANHPIILLLDAFELIRKTIPSAILLLVGGGEDYDNIAQEIQRRGLSNSVVLAGHVNPESVASIYAASHLVVDPVFDDDAARARSPLKIVESLAMGVPVVTGNTGDRILMLEDGRAGVLVKPGSPAALAEGVISALKNSVCYNEMAHQAQSASEQFRWDHLVHKFVEVYSN
jgi:glycosyltransferase involved in cell wall biosynthesis